MIRSCGWYLLITHKASTSHDMSCDVIFNMLNILLPSSSRWPFVVRFSKSIHQTDGHTISYHVICMPGGHDLTAQLEDPLTPIGQKAKWPQHFRLVFFQWLFGNPNRISSGVRSGRPAHSTYGTIGGIWGWGVFLLQYTLPPLLSM